MICSIFHFHPHGGSFYEELPFGLLQEEKKSFDRAFELFFIFYLMGAATLMMSGCDGGSSIVVTFASDVSAGAPPITFLADQDL